MSDEQGAGASDAGMRESEGGPAPADAGQLERTAADAAQQSTDAGLKPAAAGRGGAVRARSIADAGAREDDAGEPAADGGVDCREFVMPGDCTTPENRVLPSELRCTGLYGDWATRSLACSVTAYRPAYELYSDGARKQRWFSLPEGGHIDGSQPESFVFPVGTQFWKEFRVEVGGKERLVETRLLRKIASGKNGWVYTSYVWDERGEKAVQLNDGADNVLGSDHEVPTLEKCRQCHAGRADFILGFDPILLGPGATGVSLDELVKRGTLQNMRLPVPAIPGSASDVQALGYLHANCGVSCHNPAGDAKDSGFHMRLELDKLASVGATPVVATGLNKMPAQDAKIQTLMPPSDMAFCDVVPQRPDASLVLVRMKIRGSEAQMPPIASKHVDSAGVEIVTRWLEQ
jgi:hypothetical protein